MSAFIAIDAGTTTSRAWRVVDGRIAAAETRSVGVRDTARDGHSGQLIAALGELVAAVRGAEAVSCVAASGMITSSLGLREIPHCDTPAGVRDLAGHSVTLTVPKICELPIVLFPGVRTGDWSCTDTAESCDMMRGEETLCIGLAEGRPSQDFTVLNLGSHWKAIQWSHTGHIAGSWTTLSGEQLHAIMTQTILASAVPSGRPSEIDLVWCRRGEHLVQQHGFSRALFEVRLWEVRAARDVTAIQRLSFLIGTLIEDAWQAFEKSKSLTSQEVILLGQGSVATAWIERLRREGRRPILVSPDEQAQYFVNGIRQLLQLVNSY